MLALEIVTPVAASGLFSLAWLMIAIPAASAAVLLLVGRAGDAWGLTTTVARGPPRRDGAAVIGRRLVNRRAWRVALIRFRMPRRA